MADELHAARKKDEAADKAPRPAAKQPVKTSTHGHPAKLAVFGKGKSGAKKKAA
jgi:hypothetical protein